MRTIEDLLKEYGESHQNPMNKIIHWVCIPLLLFCTFGMIWLIPVPDSFKQISFPINWATILMGMIFIYYSQLSRSLSYGMVFIYSGIIGILYNLVNTYGNGLFLPLFILWVIAWILQIIGHQIEGKKPSFMSNLQFLLVGPLWIIHSIVLLFKKKI